MMKKFITVLKWSAIILVVLVVGLVIFVQIRAERTWDAPYPDISASQDSALIEHGRYLVYGPAHCAGCHAPRSDVARLEMGEEIPPSGGEDFILPVGTVYTPNITPDPETGIGSYTDQEIARAMRYGVKRNGQALVDFMPFYDLSDRDLTAIISYLRTVPAVRNERPQHEWNFMGKVVRAFGMIRPMGDGKIPAAPEPDTTIAYGAYLSESVANCRGCHTMRDLHTGGWIGPEYAGQMVFDVRTPAGETKYIVTPNLTPDPETGILHNWTQKAFVQRFRTGMGVPGTIMPWGQFSRMTDNDLIAIYKFLGSLEPIRADHEIPFGLLDGNPQTD